MATIPLTEAKAKLNELVEEATSTHERVTITRRGCQRRANFDPLLPIED